MKNKAATYLLLTTMISLLVTGCSTTLQHGKIYAMPTADKGAMRMADTAKNMNARIGWGTLTIFAIPVAPVTVNGVPGMELMNQIKDAVEQAGYKVQMLNDLTAVAKAPVLSCQVHDFGFRNYTWLFPLVFNWGTIKLDVTITGEEGKVLWQKSYTGKAHGFYDFNPTVNKALTTILNELASDLANEQFSTKTSGVSRTE
jgi:hypothetical protein